MDSLSADGLVLNTYNETLEDLKNSFRAIYGMDINLDSNSPDGQWLNILAQRDTDTRELIMKIFSSFDPDQANGLILDQRCSINGTKRNTGSFTIVEEQITVDRALSLKGLDSDLNNLNANVSEIFTIRDNAGNYIYLIDSIDFVEAGTYTVFMRAQKFGPMYFLPNSFTTPVTTKLGVTGVNNADGYYQLGEKEETDNELKIRRRKGVTQKSIGFVDALENQLNSLTGVISSKVFENYESIESVNGTPPHSIWVIVDGGEEGEIAKAIYYKKAPGCGMRGATEVNIEQSDGRLYKIKFDRPVSLDLYIRFSIYLPGGAIDPNYIKNIIVENVFWGLGQSASTDAIISFLKSVNKSFIITACALSLNGADWGEVLQIPGLNNYFINSVSRISLL